MIHLLALALLTQSPGAPKSLAAPSFSAVNVDQKLAAFYADHLAQQLALSGFPVVSESEIAALVGFERQKELLGCGDTSTSCLAELGNALGVDGLLMGSIAKLENLYQLNVKVVSTGDAKVLALYSSSAEGERALLGKVEEAAKRIAEQLRAKGLRSTAKAAVGTAPPPAVEKPVEKDDGRPSQAIWYATGGGLAAVGGGAVVFSYVRENQIDAAPTYEEARNRATQARLSRGLGYALVGTGVAAAAFGVVRHFTSAGAPKAVSAVSADVAPGYVGLQLSGAF